VRKSEASSYQATVREQGADLFRSGVSCDIEILRLMTEQKVPDAAADQKRRVAGVLESVKNLQRVPGDVGPRDAVVGPGNNFGGMDREPSWNTLTQLA